MIDYMSSLGPLFMQHTPRVNGEIPDVNYATLDHQRLAERLWFREEFSWAYLIEFSFISGYHTFSSLEDDKSYDTALSSAKLFNHVRFQTLF